MTWNDQLTNLNHVLAGLYPAMVESYRVLDTAGIPKAYIEFSTRSIDNWHAILSEAKKRDKVLAVIQAARKDYPDNPFLIQAERGELTAVRGPIVGVDVPWKGAPTSDTLEKIIGAQSTLVPISFLEIGLQRARSVVRVVLANGALGSGFLISDNLLVTNHHVIHDAQEARTATVEFNYQQDMHGRALAPTVMRFDPDAAFVTSVEDDWSAVRVAGDANATWGAIPLEPVAVAVDDRVNIIQHPGGGTKQLSFFHNVVTYADSKRVQYLTDTLPGSSGSPVFDRQWRLVAVHHSGGWMPEPGSNINVLRNEGISVSCILEALRQRGLVA